LIDKRIVRDNNTNKRHINEVIMKKIVLTINSKKYEVTIKKFGSEEATLIVDDKEYTVGLDDLGISKVAQVTPMQISSAPAARATSPAQRSAPAAPAAAIATPLAATASAPAGGKGITAPLPGLVIEFLVKIGDTVKVGQDVVIMEAMKMENHIASNFSGVVKVIHVKTGESVPEGALLITLE